MRWLASDTCAPEPKFCRYAVYAATVPVFSASAQAFSSASWRACSSAACGCAPVCCESEDWLQAEMRAAPAMAPTNAHFGNATRLADLGFRGGQPFMAVLLWLHRPTRPLAMSSLSMCSSRGSTQPPFAKPPVVGSACHRLPAKYLSWSEWDTGPADLATVAMAKRIRCRFSVHVRARVLGPYS